MTKLTDQELTEIIAGGETDRLEFSHRSTSNGG